MTYQETKALEKIVGSEPLLKIMEIFPNKKLPGKKIAMKYKREKFLSDYKNGNTNVQTLAIKHGIGISTGYKWIERK